MPAPVFGKHGRLFAVSREWGARPDAELAGQLGFHGEKAQFMVKTVGVAQS